MPTIIPSYVYTLFAALIVGSIIIYSVSVATLNIRTQASTQQLKNVNQYVAAQSLTLLSQTTQNNQNTTQFLDIPTSIGNQRFWIHLENGLTGAYVISGFGATVANTEYFANIPAQANVSGTFVSGSGRPALEVSFENQTATLTLTSE